MRFSVSWRPSWMGCRSSRRCVATRLWPPKLLSVFHFAPCFSSVSPADELLSLAILQASYRKSREGA